MQKQKEKSWNNLSLNTQEKVNHFSQTRPEKQKKKKKRTSNRQTAIDQCPDGVFKEKKNNNQYQSSSIPQSKPVRLGYEPIEKRTRNGVKGSPGRASRVDNRYPMKSMSQTDIRVKETCQKKRPIQIVASIAKRYRSRQKTKPNPNETKRNETITKRNQKRNRVGGSGAHSRAGRRRTGRPCAVVHGWRRRSSSRPSANWGSANEIGTDTAIAIGQFHHQQQQQQQQQQQKRTPNIEGNQKEQVHAVRSTNQRR